MKLTFHVRETGELLVTTGSQNGDRRKSNPIYFICSPAKFAETLELNGLLQKWSSTS